MKKNYLTHNGPVAKPSDDPNKKCWSGQDFDEAVAYFNDYNFGDWDFYGSANFLSKIITYGKILKNNKINLKTFFQTFKKRIRFVKKAGNKMCYDATMLLQTRDRCYRIVAYYDHNVDDNNGYLDWDDWRDCPYDFRFSDYPVPWAYRQTSFDANEVDYFYRSLQCIGADYKKVVTKLNREMIRKIKNKSNLRSAYFFYENLLSSQKYVITAHYDIPTHIDRCDIPVDDLQRYISAYSLDTYDAYMTPYNRIMGVDND